MSLCGHDVPADDVLVEDVPAEDVPAVEDVVSTQGHPSTDFMSLRGHYVLNDGAGMSSAGTSCPHRDVLNGDVLIGDIYVHFYFCPFVHNNHRF